MSLEREVREALAVSPVLASPESKRDVVYILDPFDFDFESPKARLEELYTSNSELALAAGDWLYQAGIQPSYKLALIVNKADRLYRIQIKEDLKMVHKIFDVVMPVVNKRLIKKLMEALDEN